MPQVSTGSQSIAQPEQNGNLGIVIVPRMKYNVYAPFKPGTGDIIMGSAVSPSGKQIRLTSLSKCAG
jgi:hypothetical protein